MEDDWDLEDWLLEAGEAAEKKHLAGDPLSPTEVLTRELWVFDMQSLNGGVSQYFCNYSERWPAFVAAVSKSDVEPLQLLVNRIAAVIGDSEDPYSVLCEASGIDDDYYANRLGILRRIQALANAA